MNIGLLASGGLGFTILNHLLKDQNVSFVMTDNRSASIIEMCQQKKIELFVGNPRNGKCQKFISNKSIDVLASINYLFLIERDLINLPKKISFNIHGSLLPKYRGRTPHVWAIINNEKETGITAHLIDDGCDTGDIIDQVKIPIRYNDTGASILEKYSEQYIPLIDRILKNLKEDNLKTKKQINSKATYFGKRTPDNGQIYWDWQKERIYNWVRAQTHPYPGAFSFYKNQKIIIDKISFDEFGFNFEMPNGMILSTNPLLIKTPNGVIKIEKIRENYLDLKTGEILR